MMKIEGKCYICPGCSKSMPVGKPHGGIKCQCGYRCVDRFEFLTDCPTVPKRKKMDITPEVQKKIDNNNKYGVGSNLKRTLSRFGITEIPGCGCADLARLMNLRGPDWCEKHFDTLINILASKAEYYNFTYNETAARFFLRRAIKKCRRKQKSV